MKIYTVFLSLIFCIFVNSQSLIDECKELDTLINNNFAEFEFNRPDVDQFDRVYWVIDDMSYGVNNPIQYKRSKSNNLYVDIVSPKVSQIHMIGFGEEVYSINGLLVSKMTDEEIDDEVGRLNDLKEDLEIVESITSQAAVSLQNAQGMEEMVKSREKEMQFLDIVSDITAEIDLGSLLQRVMTEATAMLNADRSTLFLNDCL